MGQTRLLELLNREPHDSERPLIIIVNGEDPITIDPGRSINLPIDSDGVFLWIGRKTKPPVLDLPEALKAIVERQGDFAPVPEPSHPYPGDLAAPTGDETSYDPKALTFAILDHVVGDLPTLTPADFPDVDLSDPASIQAQLDALRVDEIVTDARQVEAAQQAAVNEILATTVGTYTGNGVTHDGQAVDVGAPNLVTHATFNGQVFIDQGDGQASVVSDGGFLLDAAAPLSREAGGQSEPAGPNPDYVPPYTAEQLDGMTFAQLKEIATGYGFKVRGKAEAVREILAYIAPATE